MAKGGNAREPFDFYLPEDLGKPVEDRSVFELRPLSRREQREADNLVNVDPNTGQVSPRIGDIREGALMVGIKGCRNFVDHEGNPVEFKRLGDKQLWLGSRVDPPHPDFMENFTKSQEIALTDAIINNSRVKAEEGKD